MLLIAAGDHPERLRSEAAWAHLCATAPIPASSGKTVRHRLNPGGDRQANHALWRIVITRMSSHPPTRAYVERRAREGLSKKEIIRCLKRYVAREVYRSLPKVGWPRNRHVRRPIISHPASPARRYREGKDRVRTTDRGTSTRSMTLRAATCVLPGQTGAPPGTRTPNPRIKSLSGPSSPGLRCVRATAQLACMYSCELRRTWVNCNPNCNPGRLGGSGRRLHLRLAGRRPWSARSPPRSSACRRSGPAD
jgi:Transposase IS116/IS110/IS902 family